MGPSWPQKGSKRSQVELPSAFLEHFVTGVCKKAGLLESLVFPKEKPLFCRVRGLSGALFGDSWGYFKLPWLQHGHSWGQLGAKRGPKWAKMEPRTAKMGQDERQERPRCAKMGPKRGFDGDFSDIVQTP